MLCVGGSKEMRLDSTNNLLSSRTEVQARLGEFPWHFNFIPPPTRCSHDDRKQMSQMSLNYSTPAHTSCSIFSNSNNFWGDEWKKKKWCRTKISANYTFVGRNVRTDNLFSRNPEISFTIAKCAEFHSLKCDEIFVFFPLTRWKTFTAAGATKTIHIDLLIFEHDFHSTYSINCVSRRTFHLIQPSRSPQPFACEIFCNKNSPNISFLSLGVGRKNFKFAPIWIRSAMPYEK